MLNAFLNNMSDGVLNSFIGECHWNFYDWSEGHDGYNNDKSQNAVLNLLFYKALLSYKQICDTCGIVFELSRTLDTLKASIKESFYDKKTGLFVYSKDNQKISTLACSLALYLDICSGEESQTIADYLTSGKATEISLSVKCFIYDALLKHDSNKYKSFVLDSIKGDYLPMLETGTVWETAEGFISFDNAGSLCHGWSAIPVYYYHKLLK